MAVEKSSLSIAIAGFADFLAANVPQDVMITVDSPNAAHEQAKGADKAVLNIFCYRLAPSGIHPELGPNDPLFLRASVLLTAFSNSTDATVKDTDLRVLGQALSILSSNPVIPVVLPADGAEADGLPDETTFYRLQAVLQKVEMEEMNHIWSIQGSDLAYRLSAAYELALIPIEPLEYADPVPEIGSVILDIGANGTGLVLDADGNQVPPGQVMGATPIGIPPKGGATGWLPFTMFKSNGALRPDLDVAPGTASVDVVVAGRVGEDAEIVVNWTRSDGTEVAQNAQTTTVSTAVLDGGATAAAVTLTSPADGDVAVIRTRAAAPEAPLGNTLTLTVSAP